MKLKKNQLIQFGDNMYKTFLKNIKASIRDYFPLPELSYKFSIKDDKGNDVSNKILNIIASGKTLKNSDPLLELIANSPTAALAYIAKKDTEERRKQILTKIPNLSLAFASDFQLALQYIMYCLDKQPEKDEKFFNYFQERLNQNPKYIPAFIWVTGYYNTDLIKKFCETYAYLDAKSADYIKSDVREFLSALYKHGGESLLNDYYSSIKDFETLVDNFKKVMLIDDDEDPNNPSKKNSITSILNSEFLGKLQSLIKLESDNVNKLSSTTDISDNDLKAIVDSADTGESLDDLLRSGEDSDLKNDSIYNNWVNLINLLKKERGIVANIRGKKMFKLAKAYTRYYIKNMLPTMLKQANNDPESTSKVIKVSTDEIQDLMYGDTVNHPENLAEVSNPAVRDQIAFDVEQAVKGDQIPGGAADGMSIEDIAKKWSEIYKQVPYEHLLEVLKTQEQAGSIVEQEHTDNLEIAKEIARDHLVEAPDYYTHLENMEELFPADNVSEKSLPEPEGMDLETLKNPLPKQNEDHVCDGSCGGNCQCHHDEIKTVEDKLQGLDGNGMMIIMVDEVPDIQEEQPLDFIQQIAAKIKR